MAEAPSEHADSGIEIGHEHVLAYLYGAQLQCLRQVQTGMIRPDELAPHLMLMEEVHAHYQRGGSLVVFATGRHVLVPSGAPAR